MANLLSQFGLDQSFFVLFGVFTVLFMLMSQVFFKPFLKLIQARHKRLVEDREAAESLLVQAQTKFEDYNRKIQDARLSARAEMESILADARKQESEILNTARTEAKKITQEAAEEATRAREAVRGQLQADADFLAAQLAEKVLVNR